MAQNLKRQAELIAALAASFRVQADEALFLGYELGLIGVHTEDLERAVSRALQSCRFMPSPAELREYAGAALNGVTKEGRPLLAWEAFRKAVGECGVYRSVDFDDPIINATVRALGGWERACELEGDQFYVWFRKDFERTYATLMESGCSGEMTKRLTGTLERIGCEDGNGSGLECIVKYSTGLPSPDRKLIGQTEVKRVTLFPSTEPAT